MKAESRRASDEAQIRALIEARAEAVRARDIERAMTAVAPDVLVFDVIDPLRHFGSDALRERAKQWFSTFQGPIGYEIRDLGIAAGADVACSYSLNRVVGTLTDGTKVDMWWRSTACYRRIDGRWRIIHEHNSVPFNPVNGRASLDLQP